MKNYFVLFSLFLISSLGYSQNLIVTLDTNNVCSGESITATVKADTTSIATPVSTANNNNGVMFDVTATNPIIVRGFKLGVISNNTNFEVYYRTGSHVGFENNSAGWMLLGSSSNISAGTGVDIGVDISQAIIAGQTLAFYVTSTVSSNYIYYNNGVTVGDVLASDANITIKEGTGKVYPFGASFSPRNLVGTLIYEPVLTGITWNVSNNTTNSVTFTETKSKAVIAKATHSGTFSTSGFSILNINETEVTATATQPVIIPGQSTVINSTVEFKKGSGTTFRGGNSADGAMLDIEAVKPISIYGFSVNIIDSAAAGAEIYMKTGSHVGFETDSTAWTLISNYSVIPMEDSYFLGLSSPQTLVAGQKLAFYITRTDDGNILYSNGNAVGDVVNNDGNIIIYEGTGNMYPFGPTFSPRILNTIVHYSLTNPTGTTYSWLPGGETSSSITVSPQSSTLYTLNAVSGGCSGSDTAQITIGVNSIEEHLLGVLSVFPNPSNGMITISLNKTLNDVELTIVTLSGREIYHQTKSSMFGNTEIDISKFETGMYILLLKSNSGTASYRIQKI